VVKEALNLETMAGLVSLVKAVVRMAVLFELVGAALLCFRFVPLMGWRQGVFFSLFHSISAFGNAGFDLFGGYDSLTRFPTDYLVNGTILAFICHRRPGLHRSFRCGQVYASRLPSVPAYPHGFDYLRFFAACGNRRDPGPGISQSGHNGRPTTGGKVFSALFTAATPRTAGFSVLNTGAHFPATMLVLMALMFIGASPASTGGGVKTTTFGAVVIAVAALIRGRQEPVLFLRRLPLEQIFKAVAIIGGAAALIFRYHFRADPV
jgi:trk system potassium uptake protein